MVDLGKSPLLENFLQQNEQGQTAASLLLKTSPLCFFGTYNLSFSWNPFPLMMTGVYPEVLTPDFGWCDIYCNGSLHWDMLCTGFWGQVCCRKGNSCCSWGVLMNCTLCKLLGLFLPPAKGWSCHLGPYCLVFLWRDTFFYFDPWFLCGLSVCFVAYCLEAL